MSPYPDALLGTFLKPASDWTAIDPEHIYETAGIYSYGRGLFKRPPISGSETNYPRYNRLHVGQFVYSRLFGWEGALAMVTDEFDGLYVSHEFPTFNIDQDIADPAYVSYLARWPDLHTKLRDKTTGMGSRRQRVSPERVLATPVPLPDLVEQRRISVRLDSASIVLRKVLKAKEQAKKLRDGLRGALFDSAEALRPLGDFLEPTGDYVNVDEEKTYRTAGIYSYGRGIFARPPISGSETNYKKYNVLHTGQFVYSKLFGWEGALAMVTQEFDGLYVSHEFPTFNITENVADTRYVAHLARWPALHAQLRDKTTGMGSRRQRVNVDRLLSARVPLPELSEQRRVADYLDRTTKTDDLATRQESIMSALRESLLNAAFSGQL